MILVEGILIFTEAALRNMFDVKIFVDTDSDLRFIRRLERDLAERGRTTESVIKQYQLTVRPMHMEFVEPSKRYADVIIPEGGHNTAALDMVVARVESSLNNNHVGEGSRLPLHGQYIKEIFMPKQWNTAPAMQIDPKKKYKAHVETDKGTTSSSFLQIRPLRR